MLIFHVASGQYGDLYEKVKMKYPDDPVVFLERSEIVSIIPDNDSLDIITEAYEDILHLKEKANAYSVGRVYGSHFNQVKDIKAKTLIWERNRFKTMDVSDFKKNNDRDAGVFYDDSYYYSFNYPAVGIGNRTQLRHRSIIKDSRFLPGFLFPAYAPQVKASYTIKTTADVELFYIVKNDPDDRISFRKFTKNGFDFYEWTSANVPARKTEESAPSVRYYEPHVICYVKSFASRGKHYTVLSDINDLYQWYYGFVGNLNKQHSVPLKETVEKIRSTCKTEIEVVEAVFYWVQDNIQYIAFEDGMRGLIPHEGEYVFTKRYGDCKDMANLLVAMLNEAGIKGYHTWIGTRDLPYKYSELPTPLVDNHMIATYIGNDGRYFFMDATGDYTPFGTPSSMIQGKEALVGLGPDRFEVKTIPAVSRLMNITRDSVSVSIDLDHSQLNGKGKTTLEGYAKIFGAYKLNRAEVDDVKRSVTSLTGKGSNKFFLDSYEISNNGDRVRPTSIDYTFRIGDYYQKTGNELYVNLNLNKDFFDASINTSTRLAPKESEFRYEHWQICELIIPEGYTVDYLPEASVSNGPLLGFESRYERRPGSVILTRKLYCDFLMLMPDQFESWNKSVQELSDSYKESIILKKI